MATKSVGANLREAREKRGFTLAEIGARTRITVKCLSAIEDDDVSKLSSPFFYRSFVRQYAEELDVDFHQLSFGVEQLAGTMRVPDLPGQGEHQPVRVAPIQPRLKRDLGWVYPVVFFLGAVVTISSGYAAWRYQPVWLTETAVGTFIKSFKPGLTPATTTTSSLVKPIVPSRSEARTITPAAVPVKPMLNAKPGSDKPVDEVAEVPSAAAASSEEETAPAAGAVTVQDASPTDVGIHLELAATERTWLSVTADGKEAYSGILEKEEVKVLDGQETAKLRTGNAAGVNIIFNGKPIGSIGPRGTLRTVVFTKTSYEVLPLTLNHPQFTRATRIGG